MQHIFRDTWRQRNDSYMASDTCFPSKASRSVWIPEYQSRFSGCHKAGKEINVQVRDERGDFVLWPHSVRQETISCPPAWPLLLAPAKLRTRDEMDPHTDTCSGRFLYKGPIRTPQTWGRGSRLSSLAGARLPSASPASPNSTAKQHLEAANQGTCPRCLS